jgi:hypothetical protein
MDGIEIAEDMAEGVEEIALVIGKSKRQTYHLCETKQIPAFKLAGKWHMRRSTYRKYIEALEAAAMGQTRAA